MAYLKKLPYNHFNPTKPQVRIVYHANGSKTETKLEAKPDPYQAELHKRICEEACTRLNPHTFHNVKGEFDQYDGATHKRVSPDKMEKEI